MGSVTWFQRFRVTDVQIISAYFTAGTYIDDDVKATMLAEAEKLGYDVSDIFLLSYRKGNETKFTNLLFPLILDSPRCSVMHHRDIKPPKSVTVVLKTVHNEAFCVPRSTERHKTYHGGGGTNEKDVGEMPDQVGHDGRRKKLSPVRPGI